MLADADPNDIKRLVGCRLLVVGDLMLDRYIWGAVERISPEAPVPVVLAQRREVILGGAGNVARNIVALGGQVAVAGIVGQDPAGDQLSFMLESLGVDTAGLVRSPEQITIEKTRIMSGHQQMLRIDDERPAPASEELVERLMARVQSLLPDVGGVIVSDYGKGMLTPALFARLIPAARARGIPILIDPKGLDYRKYAGATLITPNHKELAQATGAPAVQDDDVVSTGRQLLAQLHLDGLLVTRGAQGMTLLRGGFPAPVRIRAQAREVFDVTGAGDTVIAVMGLAMAAGLAMEKAALLASAAAGVAVSKVGTAVVHPAELSAAVEQRPVTESDKVKTWPELQEQLAVLRRKGKRVIFTNGCFDLLHVGHVHLLRESSQLGDVLVVGVNSDAAIRRIKGEGRPILPEEERVQLLSALSCVNYVVVFDDDSPERLLRLVRPDVLTKGDDYTAEGVVGHEFVTEYGGEVIRIPVAHDRSSGQLIERIAAGNL